MHPNPFNSPQYNSKAVIRPRRSSRSGLALLNSHYLQKEQLNQDMTDFEKGHAVECLPEGICQGLSRYDPENLSLFGELYEWE